MTFAAIAVAGAVLAIVLHILAADFSPTPDALTFNALGARLGPEIVASIWALAAFFCVAYVFHRFQHGIAGSGLAKGLRYGTSIGLLWLVGMLEGVPQFGNPVINEFVIGLSDAIPVLVMSIMLGIFVYRSAGNSDVRRLGLNQRILTLVAISGFFIVGRYVAYITGIVESGYREFPVETLAWTILMGLCAGVMFFLVGQAAITSSAIRSAGRFGLWIFGVNWCVFLLFMPLLFDGLLTDILTRIALDVAVVSLACYVALKVMRSS